MGYEVKVQDYDLTEEEQEQAAFLLESSHASFEEHGRGEDSGRMIDQAYRVFLREFYEHLAIRLGFWPCPAGTILPDGKTVRFWRVVKTDVPTG